MPIGVNAFQKTQLTRFVLSDLPPLIKDNVPSEYMDIVHEAARLADQSHQGIVLVGGVVRDLLLGRTIRELDLMIDPPVRPIVEELARFANSKVVAHDTFHTFTLLLPFGSKLDIVTAREETYRAPAALPDVFPSTIPHDLKRRDFTINAMAIWMNQNRYGELLDPFDGESDLRKKTIRVLHGMSFVDDPTRICRAARFAGRFGFSVGSETEALIGKAIKAQIPSHLTPVRRRHEFEAILKEDNPVPALKLLNKWGMIPFLHPDWELKPHHLENISTTPPLAGPGLLVHRLAMWLKPWGEEEAKMMMTDLSFEKKIKTEVLRYIV